MIDRDPIFYVTGYEGDDPYVAPFYLRALVFDGEKGDFNAELIKKFNEFLEKESAYSEHSLLYPEEGEKKLPKNIVIVNASHDNLPTSHETARVFEDFCEERGYSIPVKVVNDREELIDDISRDPLNTLVVSQCVDKNVYNSSLAEELEREGTVTVPGKITAPGGVFSDKDSSYRLLSDNGKVWDKVARYIKVEEEGRTVDEVVADIFEAIDELIKETGNDTFFVKPHEGGGGLGGFRITKMDKGYIIPDLSKVSGDMSEIHPTFIDFDVENDAKLKELLWIYRLFEKDKKMASNYIKVKLPMEGKSDEEAIEVLKEYLAGTEERRKEKLSSMIMDKEEAHATLRNAVKIFEAKFEKRYTPLVNEHIDFGLWGLRAHYRMSRKGPVLEAMYHRIFQLGFTEEGLGYLGSDNISNKQTGDLEILRLGPINEVMLSSIGGEKFLFETLLKGVEALVELAKLLPDEEKRKVPLRVQLDLAAVSKRIGEGNADTARGMSLASRWSVFVENAREWFSDSLDYYAFKKEGE